MKAFVRLVQREAERKLRVPADYLGRMGESSFSGFLKFLMFLPLAAHRRRSDPALAHAVRIVATQHEDCGPCVQIAVNAALDDGMEPQAIRAVLNRKHEQMPPPNNAIEPGSGVGLEWTPLAGYAVLCGRTNLDFWFRQMH